jgi:type II secretory pathway pseudopilin PulG
MKQRGVTLIEVIVAFSIFTFVMTLVVVSLVQTVRSFQQGERFADRQQKQRLCFSRMGSTIQSLVNLDSSGRGAAFRGDSAGCYIIYAQDSGLAEEKYAFDSASGTLERFFQDPTDYQESTYAQKIACLESLQGCSFSYSDGAVWRSAWNPADGLPKAVKLAFTFRDDDKEHEFLANVPVQ